MAEIEPKEAWRDIASSAAFLDGVASVATDHGSAFHFRAAWSAEQRAAYAAGRTYATTLAALQAGEEIHWTPLKIRREDRG